MATLSASASIFKIPTALNPKPHELLLHHFKPNYQTPKPSKKTNPTFTSTHNSSSSSSSVNPPATLIAPKQPSNPRSHQNPSTGYAVALLDAARSHHALESVSRDVRRLSRWLRRVETEFAISNPRAGRKEKGDALREIVRRGKFHKHLSKLVTLLVGKSGGGNRGAAEVVGEVLAEFGRIYDELAMDGSDCAADDDDRVVVLVPPGAKMEIHEIRRVAEQVQKMSGAAEVTLRQVAGQTRTAPYKFLTQI